jgi:hypothetical protein
LTALKRQACKQEFLQRISQHSQMNFQ